MDDNQPASSARVATDRPGRYGKQLASHFAKRLQTDWDEATGRGTLAFPAGTADLEAQDGTLVITLNCSTEDAERLEDVVGRHLVRFGARDELVVTWQRADGTRGTEQRNTGDDSAG